MANVSKKPDSSSKSTTVARPASTEPTRNKLTSNNSDLSTCTATLDAEKTAAKKLPPIKAPVGLAKSPDLKNCKSKIGSLNNIKHTPTGGGVSIPSQKLKWNAKSKVGSLENKEHKPGGGKLKVETQKLEWKTSSKVQSLQNVHHKPGGGNVKIFNETYVNKSANSSQQTTGTNSTTDSGESDQSTPKVNGNLKSKAAEAEKSLSKGMENLNLKQGS